MTWGIFITNFPNSSTNCKVADVTSWQGYVLGKNHESFRAENFHVKSYLPVVNLGFPKDGANPRGAASAYYSTRFLQKTA